MSTAAFVRTRLGSPKFAAVLAAGDVLAVVAFVLIGSFDHGFGIDPARVVMTAAPFVLGWLSVAIPTGLYGERAATFPSAGALTVAAWTAAVAIGGTLRSTSYFPGASPLTFLLVTFVFCGIIITGWRLSAAFVVGRHEQNPPQ